MGAFIFGALIGLVNGLATIALIHIFRDKNHVHLQEQIESLDCDFTHLALRQDLLEQRAKEIEKREVVTIHHAKEATSEEVAEQIAQGIRRARAVKDIT